MLFRRLYKKNKEHFSSNPNKKKWYQTWWVWMIMIICMFIVGLLIKYR